MSQKNPPSCSLELLQLAIIIVILLFNLHIRTCAYNIDDLFHQFARYGKGRLYCMRYGGYVRGY